MITRRHFIAMMAATSAQPVMPGGISSAFAQGVVQSDLPRQVDVAIIGAGSAGIAAGHELRRRGLNFVIVEARARIGGRTFTDASLGGIFDAGAQFIHWGERNPWRTIAQDLKIEISEDNSWGSPPVIFSAGRALTPEERRLRSGGFGRVRGMIDAAIGSGTDMSFADAVKSAPEVSQAAAGLTRFTLGEEPERASIADYDQLWAGDDYILPGGYGSLVARHGQGLPVALSTPVTLVRWDGRGVVIETPRGSLQARALIITVPVGVLKTGSIRFVPELPVATLEALDGLGMGALTKIALAYDPAKLGTIEAEDFFDISSNGGTTSFELRHRGQSGLALALLGGDHARSICELGERGAVDYALDRLGSMLGGNARSAFGQGRLAGWWTDPYARGSYSIARPGRLSARAALAVPIAERIFIAGEATAGGGAMTAGGAYLEGVRAAGAAAVVARRA
jgi:monoamine oxidase